MRDRGITRPGPKAAIAAAVTIAGAAAWWNAPHLPAPARPIGAVAAIVGGLMFANYLYAHALVRRLRRGEGVIGRWTVAPADFARFRDAERARRKRKNNWRMPRGDWPEGLPVVFGTDAVLVGHSWFRLASSGLSRFADARFEPGATPSIEFSMRLTVIGAGTQGRTARYRGHLRIPIAADAGAEAARVLGYFRAMVAL